ncbi:MAG: hypothetical protein U1C73_13715, partial [Dietzia sp.]|nr:hypothetical protein [Dietzia sp.]
NRRGVRQMTTLFTDDDVVAVAARESAEFPLWLPTVARLPGATMGAILRGTRSLLVRGLASEGEKELVIHTEASDRIGPFVQTRWRHRCFSYTTVTSFPVAAGGGLVFADNRSDRWFVDEVSTFGIHSIRASSGDEFETSARAFLDTRDSTFPVGGGLGKRGKTIAVYSEGLSMQLIVKTEDGFYLAGAAARPDLPVAVPGSDFAFRRIDEAEAAGHLGVADP